MNDDHSEPSVPKPSAAGGWMGVSLTDDQLTVTDTALELRTGAGPMKAELKALQSKRRRVTLAALVVLVGVLTVIVLFG